VSGKKLLENSNAMIKKTFEVNSIALAYTVKEFLPAMLEMNRGHIVTVASMAGVIATPGLADYSASKAAAIGFDESLRAELSNNNSNVTTTCVCPYFINTGMFDGVQTKFPSILPIVTSEYASERIVDGILKEEHQVVFPWFISLAFAFKGILPPMLYDMAMGFFGANMVMKDFRGKM